MRRLKSKLSIISRKFVNLYSYCRVLNKLIISRVSVMVFDYKKCFSRKDWIWETFMNKKVEIFYTLDILVMKLKQLQKGQNLIGYWSLDAWLSCSSFSCCQSYIASVFTMWSAKQFPIDSQTKVSFKMTKNRTILQFLYWAPHPSLK